MPCWTIRETTVLLGTKTNLTALKAALSELLPYENFTIMADGIMGNRTSFSKETGKLNTPASTRLSADKVNACYAKHVILANARKAGWSVKKQSQSNIVHRRG